MKVIIFKELLEMVEDKFGFEIANKILDDPIVKNNGEYSNVGTYPFEELLTIVINLNKATEIPVNELLVTYGKHLSDMFLRNYTVFFDHHDSLFSFLSSIESVIHVEVLKLYNDASLPKFNYSNVQSRQMIMIYKSERALHDLAEGLIIGCSEIYNESTVINKEMIKEDDTEVKFTIEKTDD